MRQAYIGEDGRIYDAEGQPADGQKKTAPLRSSRPMVTNSRRERGGFFRGLAQASVDIAPSVQPPSPGIAYRTAVRVAVPLSQGFTWSRDGGSPSSQVFPGRFVVSPRYPGNLFRVAFRPSTDNNPAMTRLAILEGTGAGSYIEVPIYPDGTTNPSLLGEFLVVPGDQYFQVEYSIYPYPAPQVDGGEWRATFPWIYSAIDQAAFQATSFNESVTPVDWGNVSSDSFATAAAALGFIVDAIDMIGWAYDFGRIGDKELKILTKVGTDIFVRVSDLYSLLNPQSENTVFRSSDQEKTEAFQKKVDEMVTLRPYWSVMLARAMLYNQQTELASAWLGQHMFDVGITWAEDSIGRLNGLRPSILASLTGQLPEDQANTNLNALAGQYQATVDGLYRNQATFQARWKVSGFDDYKPEGMYAYAAFYNLMLEDNAALCMQVRESIKETLSADLPCGDEGLSQAVAASVIPVQFAAVVAGMGPGVEARREIGNILRNDILKNEQNWVAHNMRESEAVAKARDKIAGIRKDFEKLQSALGLDQVLPLNVIEKPATELRRSVAEIEDPALRAQARKALRQLDFSPESALRQGFDNVTDKLDQAEKAMGGMIFEEDGKTPKPADRWNDEEKLRYQERQDDAAKLVGEALTEGFSVIVKNPKGEEIVADILALGLTTGKGELKEALSEKIAVTVMNSAVESELFSPGALAGLGKVIAGDVGLKPEVIGRDFARKSVEFRTQAESLTKVVMEPDPVTQIDQPRTIQVGKKERDLLSAKADQYERLAVIFASEAAAEGMTSIAAKEQMIRFRDVIDTAAAKGQVAPADLQVLARADAALANADSVSKLTDSVQKTFVGERAAPENIATMAASDANKDLARTLNSRLAQLNAAITTLKAYTGPEGKARLATGKLSLKEVYDAIAAVEGLMMETQRAQDAVNVALSAPTAARRRAKLAKLMNGFYTKGISPLIEFGKKNSIAGVIALILMGPLVFGILWAPVQLIAWGFGKHVGNPIFWFSDAIETLLGLFRSRRVGDVEARDENKPSTWNSNFFLTALGISMIFFGKQLFPVIGEGLKLVGASLKTVHDLIPWAKKKKGQRGRPSGDGGEKKLKGRGAPIDIEQAEADLDEARANGDERAEKRIIDKLKRAAERGQSVPPGLWGYRR